MRYAHAGLLVAAFVLPLTAQEPRTEPASLIRIFCERIKEGHETAHEAVEKKFAAAARKAKFPWGVLGMDAVTGPNEVWFIQPFDSFADFQKAWDAFDQSTAMKAEMETLGVQDGEQRVSGRTLLARYRPAMSYRATEAVANLPRMRYVQVLAIHVKPGYDSTVHEVARIGIAALEKANDERPLLTYQVISGEANTYLLFRATADWASLDKEDDQARALYGAMGEDLRKYVGGAREAISSEDSMIFALNAGTSVVPKSFVDADPAFWTPKPAPAPKKKTATTK